MLLLVNMTPAQSIGLLSQQLPLPRTLLDRFHMQPTVPPSAQLYGGSSNSTDKPLPLIRPIDSSLVGRHCGHCFQVSLQIYIFSTSLMMPSLLVMKRFHTNHTRWVNKCVKCKWVLHKNWGFRGYKNNWCYNELFGFKAVLAQVLAFCLHISSIFFKRWIFWEYHISVRRQSSLRRDLAGLGQAGQLLRT